MSTKPARMSWMLLGLACFAVVAGWQLGVRTLRSKLEARRDSLQDSVAELDQGRRDRTLAARDPAEMLKSMRGQRDLYKTAFSRNLSAQEVYPSFDRLASQAHVRIDRIEPTSHGVQFRDGAATVGLCGFVVNCAGTYDQVCEFIRLVSQDNGLTRIQSIRIIPEAALEPDAPKQVVASLSTEHIGITGIFDDRGGE